MLTADYSLMRRKRGSCHGNLLYCLEIVIIANVISNYLEMTESLPEPFYSRGIKFSSCNPNKTVSHEFRLRCYENFCYNSCLKCGSTSMRSFGTGYTALVRDCDFQNSATLPILVLYRPYLDHFMSGYGQITYQGLKRRDKVEQAQRNSYGHVDVFDNSEDRLSKFIDAVEDKHRQEKIPDFPHIFQMMHFFKELHACVSSPTRSPRVIFVNLSNLTAEWEEVAKLLGIKSSIGHSRKHAAHKPPRKQLKQKTKEAAQYIARNTKVSPENLRRINKLRSADISCLYP